jgi:hypothetical protein
MRLLGLVMMLLAVAAASCGGDGAKLSKQEYEQRLQALPRLFVDPECEVPDGVSLLRAREAVHREIVAALEALEPPGEVADAHGKLVSAHRKLADPIDGTIESVRELPDPGEAPSREEQADRLGAQYALAARERPDVPELAEAQRELGDAGYTVEAAPFDPERYTERANELLAPVTPITLRDVGTVGELQTEAEEVGTALVDAAQQLAELVPPRPVAEAHEHLVLGLCTRGQELVSFARFRTLDPDEPADVASARMIIATLDPFFEEAAGDYRDRGYDVAVPEVEAGG